MSASLHEACVPRSMVLVDHIHAFKTEVSATLGKIYSMQSSNDCHRTAAPGRDYSSENLGSTGRMVIKHRGLGAQVVSLVD